MTTHWIQWHKKYDDPESHLPRRLAVVRNRIAEALDHCPPGPIRVVSMCAGDGRDLLHVLQTHPRSADVSGRLVELDPSLAERARAAAPLRIEVSCRDAGESGAYHGAVPADLLICCGVFGNISDEYIRQTINAWLMPCAPGATVIWTRAKFEADLRDTVREWVKNSGFKEISFDGAPEPYGVGVAQMMREPMPYRKGVRFFTFITPE
jgi:hypothetical protein